MAAALINTQRVADGSVLVEVRGEIDVSSADRLGRVLVDAATRLHPARIVVDLLHLTFIDSTGIGALVSGHNAARAVGADFRLRHPSPFVITQLRQTGVYSALIVD